MLFFFNDTPTPDIYTLSLQTLFRSPAARSTRICPVSPLRRAWCRATRTDSGSISPAMTTQNRCGRSEEHTSELQSRFDLVCRLLLEKKKRERTAGRD